VTGGLITFNNSSLVDSCTLWVPDQLTALTNLTEPVGRETESLSWLQLYSVAGDKGAIVCDASNIQKITECSIMEEAGRQF